MILKMPSLNTTAMNFIRTKKRGAREGSLGSGWRDRTSLQILRLRTEEIQGASEERTA